MDVENGRKIITPGLPERALFKTIAGPGLLADLLVAKYTDSLPITRQLSRFARMGVTIAKSTVTDGSKTPVNSWSRYTTCTLKQCWKATIFE